MSYDWRVLAAEDMEKNFNPRAAVSDVDERLEDFVERSTLARAAVPGEYDLRYGERPNETLDVHTPADANGRCPLVMFVHGGYWRALDKSDHSFIAPPILNSGAVLANVNYDLCPHVTLDVIVDEIAAALRYCHANAADWGADASSIHILGHSAGAHLAAEMMLRDWTDDESAARSVKSVIALTGVYEPEVILSVSVNDEARIDRDTALARRCLGRDFTIRPATLIGVGADEPRGWIEQSRAFHAECIRAGIDASLAEVAGANHFTVLERALAHDDAFNASVFGMWRDSTDPVVTRRATR